MTTRKIEALVRYWQEILQLQEWKIEVEVIPAEHISGDRLLADIDRDYSMLHATLTIASQRDPAELSSTVLHELLHLVLAGLVTQHRYIAGLLGTEAEQLANKEEQTEQERIVRKLERAIRKLQKEKD